MPETYTIVQCSRCQNVAGDMTCTDPKIDVFPIITMGTPKSFSDTTELVPPSERYLLVDAIKFEAEYYSNPADWEACAAAVLDVHSASFFLKVWEAIMVLPLAQATTQVPAYVPKLTDGFEQIGDEADRVLWKRVSSLPMWGTLTTGGTPNLTETNRDFGHGPVVVKSKVRLDDRHGLFFVRNYVHNLFFGIAPRASCTADCDGDPTAPTIPVLDDVWMKVFYHSRK